MTQSEEQKIAETFSPNKLQRYLTIWHRLLFCWNCYLSISQQRWGRILNWWPRPLERRASRARTHKQKDGRDNTKGERWLFSLSWLTCRGMTWWQTSGCIRQTRSYVQDARGSCDRRAFTLYTFPVERGHKSQAVCQIWLTCAIPSRLASRPQQWQHGACSVLSQTCVLSEPTTNGPL